MSCNCSSSTPQRKSQNIEQDVVEVLINHHHHPKRNQPAFSLSTKFNNYPRSKFFQNVEHVAWASSTTTVHAQNALKHVAKMLIKSQLPSSIKTSKRWTWRGSSCHQPPRSYSLIGCFSALSLFFGSIRFMSISSVPFFFFFSFCTWVLLGFLVPGVQSYGSIYSLSRDSDFVSCAGFSRWFFGLSIGFIRHGDLDSFVPVVCIRWDTPILIPFVFWIRGLCSWLFWFVVSKICAYVSLLDSFVIWIWSHASRCFHSLFGSDFYFSPFHFCSLSGSGSVVLSSPCCFR